MSTLEEIVKSLEKLKTRYVIKKNYERAAEIKIVIDKIKKRLQEGCF